MRPHFFSRDPGFREGDPEIIKTLYYWGSSPPCPREKDIGRTNLRAARLLRFFYVQNSSTEKKISEGVGMDSVHGGV
jgi:hypothetical protein